ncbi:MAG: CHC2 zinc finger domain-containing protein, partial [Thermodesulfovibrionia bacterium]
MSSYNTALEEVKSRIDIVDVISEYVSLKKTGQNWRGLCLF